MNAMKLKSPWVLLKQLERKLEENKAQAEKVNAAAQSNGFRLSVARHMTVLNQQLREG
ncbi:MAG: hypothetical protein HN793_06020 [Rhodospirillaceae bacterium]|jgi:hypothetical protein|nr:hypothetical protein [Rhodospirillaceae bacterium]MBT5566628.1 hypothetical protein [Rhodospirillaceae bacterium]MBT6090718.1 hypothetical protein [Rhodospirillaceae bacterium]MBT6962263.1 hypothetical protein [Rhodospirillaceae bacterium]MBT7450363.1 hypothetical protein [Rhodospirillaceae bacterium]